MSVRTKKNRARRELGIFSNNPDDVLISASCPERINFEWSEANSFPLPEFTPLSKERFSWGKLDEDSFLPAVESAYAEVVHWRTNLFLVPSGAVGKDFVDELSKLFFSLGTTFCIG